MGIIDDIKEAVADVKEVVEKPAKKAKPEEVKVNVKSTGVKTGGVK